MMARRPGSVLQALWLAVILLFAAQLSLAADDRELIESAKAGFGGSQIVPQVIPAFEVRTILRHLVNRC